MSTQRASKGLDINPLDIVRWVLSLWFIFIFIAPVMYALSVSFRPQSEVFGPPHLLPKNPTFEPYLLFFQDNAGKLLNSVLIATGVTILILLVAIPGAYTFARKEFKGRKVLFYLIILIMLVPEVMIVIPSVQILRDFGLYNTIPGVWLALMISGMPLTVWILRDNFQKLPPNAEEAAQIYGCTQLGAFIRVILPLATPAIIAVAFLSFLFAWNEFLFTNFLTTADGPRPAIVQLFVLMGGDRAVSWPYAMAGSFIVGTPPALFYLIARRYLNEALEF